MTNEVTPIAQLRSGGRSVMGEVIGRRIGVSVIDVKIWASGTCAAWSVEGVAVKSDDGLVVFFPWNNVARVAIHEKAEAKPA